MSKNDKYFHRECPNHAPHSKHCSCIPGDVEIVANICVRYPYQELKGELPYNVTTYTKYTKATVCESANSYV